MLTLPVSAFNTSKVGSHKPSQHWPRPLFCQVQYFLQLLAWEALLAEAI